MRTSFDEVRRIAALLDDTVRTEALCALSPSELFDVAVACRDSGWLVMPDELTRDELQAAASGDLAQLRESLQSRLGQSK